MLSWLRIFFRPKKGYNCCLAPSYLFTGTCKKKFFTANHLSKKYCVYLQVYSILRHCAEILEYETDKQLEELYEKTAWHFDEKFKSPGSSFDVFKLAVGWAVCIWLVLSRVVQYTCIMRFLVHCMDITKCLLYPNYQQNSKNFVTYEEWDTLWCLFWCTMNLIMSEYGKCMFNL